MAEKLSAAVFAKFVKERAQAKDGYIMGSRGQDPKKWAKNSWWFTQYKGSQKKKALYWRENAQRVWDCQGLAEGYINQETGSKTLTDAPGEIVQQGTPMSATNFNNAEVGLLHYSVAFDMLYTITQAQQRAQEARIETLEAQVTALTASDT